MKILKGMHHSRLIPDLKFDVGMSIAIFGLGVENTGKYLKAGELSDATQGNVFTASAEESN